MPLRQVWMHIHDITPTESFWDQVDDRPLYKDDARLWLKDELIDDIRQHGIKYALNVDPYGNVKNGNMRYWVARYLLEKEDDQRFLFLPVQRNYVAGAFYENFRFVVKDPPNGPKITQEEIDQMGDKIAQDICKRWVNHTRDLTIPPLTSFQMFEIDPIDEFRMKNFWRQQRNEWMVFLQPSPKAKDEMMCFGVAGKSDYVPILKEGSEAEKKAYKEWWKQVRAERKKAGPDVTFTRPDYRKVIHGKLET